MSGFKSEPFDSEDYEVYFNHKICDIMRRDLRKVEETEGLDKVKIKLYIKQSEMGFLAKILFKNDVQFYLQESPVRTNALKLGALNAIIPV